jgi:signal peptidase II
MEPSSDSGGAVRAQVALLTSALGITVLDQAVKRAVVATMNLGESVDVIGTFVRLTRTSNTGGAFGLLRGRGSWFIMVSILAAAAIVALSRRLAASPRIERIAFSLILGGAVGNLIDRIRLGAVVDFVDIGGSAYRWPAFNVADSCITIGVTLLAVSLVLLRKAPSGFRDAPPGSGGRTDAGDAR